jgi:hypothetical protein
MQNTVPASGRQDRLSLDKANRVELFSTFERRRRDEILSPAERRRVQIAFLTLVEQEHILRLAQVRAERRALERHAEGCR